jgi:hypothetical protein
MVPVLWSFHISRIPVICLNSLISAEAILACCHEAALQAHGPLEGYVWLLIIMSTPSKQRLLEHDETRERRLCRISDGYQVESKRWGQPNVLILLGIGVAVWN